MAITLLVIDAIVLATLVLAVTVYRRRSAKRAARWTLEDRASQDFRPTFGPWATHSVRCTCNVCR